jgi:hypothetical protein
MTRKVRNTNIRMVNGLDIESKDSAMKDQGFYESAVNLITTFRPSDHYEVGCAFWNGGKGLH